MPSKTDEQPKNILWHFLYYLTILSIIVVPALAVYFVWQNINPYIIGGNQRYVVEDNPLDVSRHPGWPKLETALDATVRREVKRNAEMATLLGGASVEYLSKATNRYLYLAIVHASVLGETRSSTESEDASAALLEKVDCLEKEKNDLVAQQQALVKEKDDLAQQLTASKYDDEELHKAQTIIADLQQQLQKAVNDKQALLDILQGAVAKA